MGIGDQFPPCRLTMLFEETDRAYLKISGAQKNFSIEDIGYAYLFIVIYNENCLACVDEVKSFNKLYQILNESEYLHNKVKVMAIGSGSKKRGVTAFKKEHAVSYPLFADENKSIFSCLGSPVLPSSYLVQIQPGGKKQILFVQQDHINHIEILVQKILSLIRDTDLPK